MINAGIVGLSSSIFAFYTKFLVFIVTSKFCCSQLCLIMLLKSALIFSLLELGKSKRHGDVPMKVITRASVYCRFLYKYCHILLLKSQSIDSLKWKSFSENLNIRNMVTELLFSHETIFTE